MSEPPATGWSVCAPARGTSETPGLFTCRAPLGTAPSWATPSLRNGSDTVVKMEMGVGIGSWGTGVWGQREPLMHLGFQDRPHQGPRAPFCMVRIRFGFRTLCPPPPSSLIPQYGKGRMLLCPLLDSVAAACGAVFPTACAPGCSRSRICLPCLVPWSPRMGGQRPQLWHLPAAGLQVHPLHPGLCLGFPTCEMGMVAGFQDAG